MDWGSLQIASHNNMADQLALCVCERSTICNLGIGMFPLPSRLSTMKQFSQRAS